MVLRHTATVALTTTQKENRMLGVKWS